MIANRTSRSSILAKAKAAPDRRADACSRDSGFAAWAIGGPVTFFGLRLSIQGSCHPCAMQKVQFFPIDRGINGRKARLTARLPQRQTLMVYALPNI
ncbi:MAG TPA: hypothetical protein VGC86_05945 [Afipia sp.]